MPRNTVVRYLTFPRPGWQQRGRKGGRKGEGERRWHFNGTHSGLTQLEPCAPGQHHFPSPVPPLQPALLSLAPWEGFSILFSQHGPHRSTEICLVDNPPAHLLPEFWQPITSSSLAGTTPPTSQMWLNEHHSCQDKMDYPSTSWPSSHGLCSTYSNCLSEKKL